MGSHDGYLYAIYPNGTQKWKSKVGTPLKKEYGGTVDYPSIASTASLTKDGTIYIVSRVQYLFALDSSDGREKWRFPVSVSFDHWPSPAVGEDGTIYIVSSMQRAGVIAINPDGTEKWYYETKVNSFSSPAIGNDGTIYVSLMLTTQSNAVIAFNPDGTIKWKIELDVVIASSPAIGADGTVYFGYSTSKNKPSGEDTFYAVNPDGSIKWTALKGNSISSSPAIGKDGTVYVGRWDKKLYSFGQSDNAVKDNTMKNNTTKDNAVKDNRFYLTGIGVIIAVLILLMVIRTFKRRHLKNSKFK